MTTRINLSHHQGILEKPAKINSVLKLRLERLTATLQLGFTDYEQSYAKKRTRRLWILDALEFTVPWVFLALIKPVYYKPSSKGGRPPIPLKVILIDTPCFPRIAAIETLAGRTPLDFSGGFTYGMRC